METSCECLTRNNEPVQERDQEASQRFEVEQQVANSLQRIVIGLLILLLDVWLGCLVFVSYVRSRSKVYLLAYDCYVALLCECGLLSN